MRVDKTGNVGHIPEPPVIFFDAEGNAILTPYGARSSGILINDRFEVL
jgi:hypothetical protein